MDPLTIAAGIAGLLSLTLDLSNSLSSYYKTAKDAPSSIQQVCQELESARSVLKQLEDALRTGQATNIAFDKASVLATALRTYDNAIIFLSAKLPKLEKGGALAIWEKMKWPFIANDIQKTLITLQGCNVTFHFSITLEGL